MQRTRGLPAPGQYAPKPLKKTLGSVAMRLDRVSYLDQAIIDNKDSQGPGAY